MLHNKCKLGAFRGCKQCFDEYEAGEAMEQCKWVFGDKCAAWAVYEPKEVKG